MKRSMKKAKKLFSLFLTLVLTVSLINQFSTDAQADEEGYYTGNGTGYTVHAGDSVTFTAEANYFAPDSDSGELVDLTQEEYSFEWYKVTVDIDNDYAETLSDVLGSDVTYTVDCIDDDDFYIDADYSTGTYCYYACYIYYENEHVCTFSGYIYNAEEYCYGGGQNYYLEEGESVTLSAVVYNYEDEEVDLSSDEYTFEWYKITVDQSTEEHYAEQSSILGTASTYTIDELTSEDIYNTYEQYYYYYICEVYKNGALTANAGCYIYNRQNFYSGWCSDVMKTSTGSELVLTPYLIDYEGSAYDLSNKDFTYEWIKVTYEETGGEQTSSETVGNDYQLTIDEVDDSDFYTEPEYYSTSGAGAHFECNIYMNGYYVSTYVAYIKDTDSLSERYSYIGENYNVSIGDTVTMEAVLYDNETEDYADLSGDEFSFEWYKLTWSHTAELETSDILSTDSTYTIDVTEDDIYNTYEDTYVEYQCKVYYNGTYVATSSAFIYSKENTYYGQGDFIYGEEGDSITLTPCVLDYNSEEVDLSADGYTFEWYAIDYGYDDDGNWCSNGTMLDETGLSYTIDSLEETDFYESNYNTGRAYECVVYLNGYYITNCWFYIYDAGGYYDCSWGQYLTVGETGNLTAMLYTYSYDLADLSGDEFSFEWYKYTYEDGEYTQSDVLSTSMTYTIDALDSTDFSNTSKNYFICLVYKNGNYMAQTRYRLYDTEYVYDNYYSEVYALEGMEYTFEAQLYDVAYDIDDLDGEEFTFEWSKYVYGYNSEGEWEGTYSDILGTDRTYTDTLYDDERTTSKYGGMYYSCSVYKNGISVGTAYYNIYFLSGASTMVEGESYYGLADSSFGGLKYAFVPDETGTYSFNVSGDEQQTVILLDSDLNEIKTDWYYTEYGEDYALYADLTAGETYYLWISCYFNSDNYVTAFVNKHTHSYTSEVTKAATCTATGVRTYTCSECGDQYTEKIAKTSHTYKTVVDTKATTSKAGKLVKKCTECGTVASTTTIAKIKSVTLSTTSYTYNGKAKKPGVTVKDSNGKTISSDYYTVPYKNNKNAGTATVTVKFKTRYSGTVTKTFTIKPKATSISKLTAKSKGFKITWKKISSQATGYQIQYATNSSFTKNKGTKTVTSYKTTSKTITNLKAKKKYYVRIRTYKTVNGKKYYSSWSKATTVTTKK